MTGFGIAFFFFMLFLAFWVLIFLATVAIPYWVTLGAFDMMRPKKVLEEDPIDDKKEEA